MNGDDKKVPNAELDYATSDAEAEKRYQDYGKIDPLPHIQPALLNSADIAEYISKTGMIFPFRPEHLSKPASYGVLLKGRCVYWDDDGKKQDFILSDVEIPEYRGRPHRKEFTLARNSIAFVTLEPIIRLPDYIAVRFNLTIQDVYRGMLLGTGPLVDPGFQTKLSFPLHNLTNNKYTYRAGDEIVWMEFTKLSKWHEWYPEEDAGEDREGKFVSFPGRKLSRKDVASYLEHADSRDPIRSSIPVVIEKARKELIDSGKRIDDLESRFRRYSMAGGLIAFVGLSALIYGGYQLVTGTLEVIGDAQNEMRALGGKIKDTEQFSNVTRDNLEKFQESTGKKISDVGQKTAVMDERLRNLQKKDLRRLSDELIELHRAMNKLPELSVKIESLRQEIDKLKLMLSQPASTQGAK